MQTSGKTPIGIQEILRGLGFFRTNGMLVRPILPDYAPYRFEPIERWRGTRRTSLSMITPILDFVVGGSTGLMMCLPNGDMWAIPHKHFKEDVPPDLLDEICPLGEAQFRGPMKSGIFSIPETFRRMVDPYCNPAA
jgi:hypothetical protein